MPFNLTPTNTLGQLEQNINVFVRSNGLEIIERSTGDEREDPLLRFTFAQRLKRLNAPLLLAATLLLLSLPKLLAANALLDQIGSHFAAQDFLKATKSTAELMIEIRTNLTDDEAKRIQNEVRMAASLNSSTSYASTLIEIEQYLKQKNFAEAYRRTLSLQGLALSGMSANRANPQISLIAARQQAQQSPIFSKHLALASRAYAAGQYAEVMTATQNALNTLDTDPLRQKRFDSLHTVYQLRSLAALEMGDFQLAVSSLLASLESQGIPFLMSSPKLVAAQRLLRLGYKDQVVSYLEKATSLFAHRRALFSQWITDIKAGKAPEMRHPEPI